MIPLSAAIQRIAPSDGRRILLLANVGLGVVLGLVGGIVGCLFLGFFSTARANGEVQEENRSARAVPFVGSRCPLATAAALAPRKKGVMMLVKLKTRPHHSANGPCALSE